ncbi:MAG: aldehyde ferredoxin oxidoreductase C-terminal domain-containing protein [Peptococcaceae bacterium]|jgi:aldehyde:ferredoxin oxidoreductase|nr:aldehyde ferredoxin oxidoreductase [Peptococcaceae bacterium]MDH7524955.1 aldehyde ferredoxin oxidoreductase C-terminal domain-containing protein [Peptococcaceae bacterium]
MLKFLRVNMKDKSIVYEDVKNDYAFFGGRGLIAKILNDEIDPKCDPLGEENKLIVCPGLLTGTMAPCSGRLSIGAKSPLTGTIKESNSGGTASQMIARLNLKGIIIEGKPKPGELFFLLVRADGAKLIPAEKFSLMNNYELTSVLQKDYGSNIGIISIGGAGERGYKNSSIQITDTLGHPSRAAGRGGLGSVMGSKGIKAIILDAPKSVPQYLDQAKFSQAARKYAKGITEHPVSGQGLPALGTASLVNMVNALGALPTMNYQQGSFDKAEDISGEKLAELQKTRNGKTGHNCHPGCVIKCSNIYNDENGNYLTSGLEYETIALNGANCGISSLDAIAKIDRFCDDFGLDTMETGCTMAVCMEAGKLRFGDIDGVFGLLREMAEGTDFGKLLGQGTQYVGQKLGVKRIPAVKGQSMAGYDPRSLKGTGVTYATSPMGADHTCGNTLGNPTVDPHKKEGQVELSKNTQIEVAAFDNLGMCHFSEFCTADPKNMAALLEMMEAYLGGEWSVQRLLGIGVQTLRLERNFNKKAGFTEKDDILPEFMYQETLAPQNTIFDISGDELQKAVQY